MRQSLKALVILALLASCGGSKDINPQGPVINQGGGGSDTPSEGSALAAWKKGELDIHFINTGRGECAFFIMPDGTQMVIDAGGSIMPENNGTNLGYPQVGISPKPNDSKVAGYWIKAYIDKCMEWTGNKGIDYILNTHFDGDHLGVGYANFGITPPTSPYGSWYQTGVTYLLDSYKVGKMIDHGYPTYDYPGEQSGTVKTNCDNYRKCADYHAAKSGLVREIFKAGSGDQLKMLRAAASYPTFKVQNVYVNGECWTGSGTATKQIFPDKSTFVGSGSAKEASPSENSCSAVVKVSYGNFDYYGGGDAGFNGTSSFAWKDVEGQVAKVVGQVEVMKATHHGSADGCSQTLLTTLNPQEIIINVWQAVQPRAETFKRMCTATNARLYATNINQAYKKDNYGTNASRLQAESGHLVVRVSEGGAEYRIYQLDDTDPDMGMKVVKVFGPFKSK